ncbi:MAG: hypothetical protein KDB26_02410 [Microthrixaceae bacterium]|nr:hypothetical protein [Microthrixaceae bacterium]
MASDSPTDHQTDAGPDPTAPQRGPQLTSVAIGDAPGPWSSAGFGVDDSGAVHLGSTILDLQGGDGGFLGLSFEPALDTSDLDGIPLFAPPPRYTDFNTARPRNPNGIVTIDHIVVATTNCDESIASFEQAGFSQRGERLTESFGMPTRQTFFWAGQVIVELIGPVETDPTKQGPTKIFGLALVSEDFDTTIEWLGDLAGKPRRAIQPGRRIATIRTRELGISVPIAVMSPHPKD